MTLELDTVEMFFKKLTAVMKCLYPFDLLVVDVTPRVTKTLIKVVSN
jgi:hypothetical protein